MAGLFIVPSDTKRDLLLLMKQRGAISLDDAEAATGLTRTTLREHLGRLEGDGLVERSTKKQGRGRPSLQYRLTAGGRQLFPTHDDLLLGRLLAFLKEEGHAPLIDAFFERFWEERLRDVEYRLSGVDPGDLEGRIAVVEALLEEQGFMPEVRREGGTIEIRECNCPFPEAVKHTRLPCRLEARFFERIFNARIGRVSYIPDGHPACTYDIPDPDAD